MADAYAVFGNPIAHSKSPAIHAAFAAQTGEVMDYRPRLVAAGEFASTARAFFSGGGLGLNITVPFKIDAYDFADQLSQRARQAAAVNTLMMRRDGGTIDGDGIEGIGRIYGDNTDGVGLLRDMTGNLGWVLEGAKVLVLGAGGAVRGVLGPLLAQEPGQLVIANRSTDKARQLAVAFAQQGVVSACGFRELAGSEFDVVINGTSAGLSGEMPELPAHLLAPGAVCYDMVYAAEATVFMRWAMESGAMAVADGLGMLVEQAAESFTLWRQRRPQTAPVIASLRQILSQSTVD